MRKLSFSKPSQSDRIIGFTIPSLGQFYVCDHDEVWKVSIEPTPRAEVTDHAPYNFVAGRSDFLGLVFEGLKENAPLIRAGDTEIAHNFDPAKEIVTVTVRRPAGVGNVDFRTLSGDWFAASLSENGNYLVLADPYDIAIYSVN